MKIWIVVGCCGRYVGYSRWNVCAFKDEKEAEEWARNAEEWARTIKKEFQQEKIESPYDLYFQTDSSGTDYMVEELELVL